MNPIKRLANWIKSKIPKREITVAPAPKEPEPPTPQPKSFDQTLDELLEARRREEQKRWLPKPTTTRRRERRRTKPPPAAQHTARIDRLMHGKGSKRTHSTYRQMRKAHKPVVEEEDD